MPCVVVLRSLVAFALAGVIVLGSRPTAIAQDASPVAAEATLETLVETLVPAEAVPTETRLTFQLWYASLAPGTEVTVPAEKFACCPGPLIEHVLAGELSLRVNGPLRVVRGATTGTPRPEEEVLPGTEVVLRGGDAVVYAQGLPTEYANHGSEPVLLVSGGLFGGEAGLPPPGYVIDNGDTVYLESPLPPGPVTLELERAILPPDALLPGPPPSGLRAVLPEPEAGFLAEQRDGSFRNLDDEAVVAYVLTLRPAGAAAGTPTAAEVIAPDTEATFGPGEWFVYEAGTVHMDRNPGNEPAVVLITGLVAADQPFLIPVDMDMATPAA